MISESLWITNVFVVGFITFAFIIIFFFIELEANNKEVKLKLRNIIALLNKYSIVFNVVIVIIGVVFLIPLLTPWGVNIFWFDWYIKNYFMYIRVPLFLTGILLIVIGLILTKHYIRYNSQSKINDILALLNKYSIVFDVVIVIIGVVFLIPLLTPWGVNIFWFDWYIKNYFMYIRVPLFLTGILLIVIGLILTYRYICNNSQSTVK